MLGSQGDYHFLKQGKNLDARYGEEAFLNKFRFWRSSNLHKDFFIVALAKKISNHEIGGKNG